MGMYIKKGELEEIRQRAAAGYNQPTVLSAFDLIRGCSIIGSSGFVVAAHIQRMADAELFYHAKHDILRLCDELAHTQLCYEQDNEIYAQTGPLAAIYRGGGDQAVMAELGDMSTEEIARLRWALSETARIVVRELGHRRMIEEQQQKP